MKLNICFVFFFVTIIMFTNVKTTKQDSFVYDHHHYLISNRDELDSRSIIYQ